MSPNDDDDQDQAGLMAEAIIFGLAAVTLAIITQVIRWLSS